MGDPGVLIPVVSTGAAVLNGIGMILIWRRYLRLAAEAGAFAAGVIGFLSVGEDGEGEVRDPAGLLALGLHFL